MASTSIVALLAAVAIVLAATPAFCITGSFHHGVASGDPLSDSIILWTRVTPRDTSLQNITVGWSVSKARDFSVPARTGTFTTNADRDWTVKVNADGLQPGIQYYYQFNVTAGSPPTDGSVVSPVGTFRLPYPEGSANQTHLRYAVYSCSNWGWGYFNAYDAGSQMDLDFWVHLGDYYYEYNNTNYPTPQQAVRYQEAPLGLQPPNEIISLQDYRQRHALYRQDPSLQAISASAALIAMWDDHEITNNARMNSAENHQPETEGNYTQRKINAVRAYHEWLPTRIDLTASEVAGVPGAAYNRSYTFGKLATLIMTESRITARSDEILPNITARVSAIVGATEPDKLRQEQISQVMALKQESDGLANQANNTLLGPKELAWIDQETRRSAQAGVTWTLYGHGTVMLPSYMFDFEKAIAAASGTPRANEWQQMWINVAYNNGTNTTQSYSTTCHTRPYYGHTLPTTASVKAAARTNQVLGRYDILTSYDAWPGFQQERSQFLAYAKQANNAVQYGGDSHAEFAGVQILNGTEVLAEFDCASVTSPAWENGAILPLDFYSAAAIAAAYEKGERYAYAGYKGFFVVDLTPTVHHVEFIHVDHCTPSYMPVCAAAFDYYAKGASGRPKDTGFATSSCHLPLKSSGQNDYMHNINVMSGIGQQASYIP